MTPLFFPISNFLSKPPNLTLNSTRTCFHLCSISWVLFFVDIIIFRHSSFIDMKAGLYSLLPSLVVGCTMVNNVSSSWEWPKTPLWNQFKEIMRPGFKVKNFWPTSRSLLRAARPLYLYSNTVGQVGWTEWGKTLPSLGLSTLENSHFSKVIQISLLCKDLVFNFGQASFVLFPLNSCSVLWMFCFGVYRLIEIIVYQSL